MSQPDVRNIIHNTALIEKIKLEFNDVMVKAPEKRADIERQWVEFRNIFTLTHDESKEIFKSQIFSKLSKMPTPKRSIVKLAEFIEKVMFPYTRAIEGMPIAIKGKDENDEQFKQRLEELKKSARRHSSLMEYQLFELNKIRRKAKQIILQYLLYDLGIMKIGKVSKPQLTYVNNEIGQKTMIMPAANPVDIFRWYVWPDSVSDKEHAKWIYEWTIQRTYYLKYQEKLGFYKNIDKALSQPVYDSFIKPSQEGGYSTHLGADVGSRINRRWYQTYKGKTDLDDKFFEYDGGYCFVFDAYFKDDIDFIDGNGVRHKEDGVPEVVNFVFVNGEIVSARLIEEDPYLDCRSTGLPNQYYQPPKFKSIYKLLYIEESLFAQMMEHATRIGGIIHNLDPSTGVNQVEDFKPERTVIVPAGAYTMHQIQDYTRGFMAVISQIESIIREELYDSPALEGKMGVLGRGARTKGGMEMMAERAAFMSLREAMNLENDIFKPALDKFYQINKEIENDIIFQSGYGNEGELGHAGYGYETVRVTPDDIRVNANFRWLGSMRIMSESNLADSLKELMMILSKYPPELVKADHVTLLRMWVEQGLGIRNGEAIIQEPDGEQSIPLPVIAQFLGQVTGDVEKAKQMLNALLIFSKQTEQSMPEQGMKTMNTEGLLA